MTTMTPARHPVVRRAADRGHANLGWLDSRHTFSFGEYYDPAHMGFGVLRVLNDDRVAGGGGFPPHPHREMEIVSYVVQGGLAHTDSTGGEGVTRPHDVQVMTAGTGVTHSEFNASDTDAVHFLQLWLLPAAKGLAPRYAQAPFDRVPNTWQLLATPDTAKASAHKALTLHARAELWRAICLPDGAPVALQAFPHGVWVQVVAGEVMCGDVHLRAGDGVAADGPLTLTALGDAHAELLAIGML